MFVRMNMDLPVLSGDTKQDIKKIMEYCELVQDAYIRLMRDLNDMLYNLDDDNMGVTLKKEKKNAWIKINATEEGLATEVGKREEGDKTLQSNIEQTAGEINTRVMATYESTVNGNGAPDSRVDKNKLYYDQTNDKYYYYSPITEQWKITDGKSIYSAFKQTPAGFEFTNDVKVNGDLISSGTITSTNIEGVNITGTEIDGGTITGATIKTAKYSNYFKIDSSGIQYLDEMNQKEGWCIVPTSVGGQLELYVNNEKVGEIKRRSGINTIYFDSTLAYQNHHDIDVNAGYHLRLRGDNVSLGSGNGPGHVEIDSNRALNWSDYEDLKEWATNNFAPINHSH